MLINLKKNHYIKISNEVEKLDKYFDLTGGKDE